MNDKKPEYCDYEKWFEDEHKIEISNKTKSHYVSVTNKIKNDFENSDVWIHFINNLDSIESQYLLEKNYQLFTQADKPKLDIKDFNSFFLKTYRKNILNNDSWPEEPSEGWIVPDNWFSKMDMTPIFRTSFEANFR